jgi:asparagine synthase (glutamine-hydrolysing)
VSGITGIIGIDAFSRSDAIIRKMIQSITHETTYSSGIIENKALSCTVGWVSRPDSFSKCMPLWNEQQNVCLIFSGELFSERLKTGYLGSEEHKIELADARDLIHSYEELDLKCFEALNGWFRGLLFDLRKKIAILFNDRYGIGRVYIHEGKDGFYFSSEAKSLLKVLPALRQFDLQGLGEFLACGCVLQNRTLFSGISLLPPASAWIFSPNKPVEKWSYFNPSQWEQQKRLSESDYYYTLKETWKDLLPRYFRSGPIGLSLTGGVDSRMILAWAPRAPGTLPCYTFGGTYRDCADVRISRELAKITRQDHTVISVGREFLANFPSWAEKAVYLSDGAVDVTGAIDLYVQAFAKCIAPIRITGTNGGEVLRRVVAFKPNAFDENLLEPELMRLVSSGHTTYEDELKGDRLSFIAFKQAPWYMGSKFILERSQLLLRMPYFDNDLIKVAYQAPPKCCSSNKISYQLISDVNSALGAMGSDRGEGEGNLQRFLKNVSFKAEYGYDYGMPSALVRIDSAFRFLRPERLFLGRHKIAHFRLWYRDELSSYLEELLLDSAFEMGPYIREKQVRKAVSEHITGRRNCTLELHKLIAIKLISKQFFAETINY